VAIRISAYAGSGAQFDQGRVLVGGDELASGIEVVSTLEMPGLVRTCALKWPT
jgi:hypothetical protein